jgi:putative IMPACT (imprinted ancient) family translation regulator
LVIVVRYFGGVKLGVGGLINAYKTAAKLVLDACDILEKLILEQFTIEFEYKNLNKVMRLIKENNVIVISQNMDLTCKFQLAIRKKDKEKLENLLLNFYEIKIIN